MAERIVAVVYRILHSSQGSSFILLVLRRVFECLADTRASHLRSRGSQIRISFGSKGNNCQRRSHCDMFGFKERLEGN
jgi:hypothetical protein